MTLPMIRRSQLLSIVAAAAACTGGKEAPKVPLGQAAIPDSAQQVAAAHALLGEGAKAALDSGNVLFRKKQYAPALVLYRSASDLAPQHAAPLFGVYMVARATNNPKLADSALVEIKKRNGPLPSATHDLTDPVLKEVHKKVAAKPATKG